MNINNILKYNTAGVASQRAQSELAGVAHNSASKCRNNVISYYYRRTVYIPIVRASLFNNRLTINLPTELYTNTMLLPLTSQQALYK